MIKTDPIAALQARCELDLAAANAQEEMNESENNAYRLGFIAGAAWGLAEAKAVFADVRFDGSVNEALNMGDGSYRP